MGVTVEGSSGLTGWDLQSVQMRPVGKVVSAVWSPKPPGKKRVLLATRNTVRNSDRWMARAV